MWACIYLFFFPAYFLSLILQAAPGIFSASALKSIISPESSDFFDRRSTVRVQILVVFILMGYVWLPLGPLSWHSKRKCVHILSNVCIHIYRCFSISLFVPISSEMWADTDTSKQYSITLIILKQEGKGQTKSFWKNDTAQVYNISWLESNGSKMAVKSTLTRTWPSVSKLHDTSRGTMTVPKQ